MKLILGGVRGTNPVAESSFMTYGGDTTAFLLEGERGEVILVDMGTGVRHLDPLLRAGARKTALVLMTHYHLDHVVGLPSLSLLYRPEWSLEFCAPPREDFHVRDVMPRILARPFWPLQMDAVHASIRFRDLPEKPPAEPYAWEGIEIRWCPVHHLGGCSAYRFDEPSTGASAVIATDIEWPESSPAEREAFLRFCREPAPPRHLLLDGHFRPDEYERFRGWGHSAWTDAVDVAEAVNPGELLIIHHAPDHDDRDLARMDQDLSARFPGGCFARQGMQR